MAHSAKACLGGAAGATIRETLCKGGPRGGDGGSHHASRRSAGLAGEWSGETFCVKSRGQASAGPRGRRSLKHFAKAARSGLRGRQSLTHFAKVALGGAAGAAILETLCKGVPRRCRGGGGP